MKNWKLGIILWMCTTQSLAENTAQLKFPAQPAQGLRPNYSTFSVTFGDGQTGRGDSLKAQTFEVRMGKGVAHNGLRMDVIYLNEGHPPGDHRDGFALQGVYRTELRGPVQAEVGVGPYYSMNTIDLENGLETNKKGLGVLATVAIVAYLRQLGPGFYVKAQYNRAQVPGQTHTDAILVGVGTDFSSGPYEGIDSQEMDLSNTQVTALAGVGKTTIHYENTLTPIAQIEIKENVSPNLSYSVAILSEGADSLAARSGIAGQVWFVHPVSDQWSISAGAGPYVAYDQRAKEGKINGVFSMQAERRMGKKWTALVRFSRVAGGAGYDKDTVLIGVSRDLQ